MQSAARTRRRAGTAGQCARRRGRHQQADRQQPPRQADQRGPALGGIPRQASLLPTRRPRGRCTARTAWTVRTVASGAVTSRRHPRGATALGAHLLRPLGRPVGCGGDDEPARPPGPRRRRWTLRSRPRPPRRAEQPRSRYPLRAHRPRPRFPRRGRHRIAFRQKASRALLRRLDRTAPPPVGCAWQVRARPVRDRALG